MWKRKDRTTATASARGLTRRLFMSGEVIEGLNVTVPDGKLGIALTAADVRIVLVDDPEALRHLVALLDALVVDGSEWRARSVSIDTRPSGQQATRTPVSEPSPAV